MLEKVLRRLPALLLVFGLAASGVASAAGAGDGHRVETGTHQRVDGIDVYYGMLPAPVAGRHPATHEERAMHGGVPAGKGQYHLVVALFDASGKRITDAKVSAAVGEFGMAAARKTLEPMRVGEATSFGNYFSLRGSGLYRIAIEIRRPGEPKPKPIEALFDYRLQ